MSESKSIVIKESNKNQNLMDKINVYKATAEKAMDDSSMFDAKLMDINSDYMNILVKTDQEEYNMLKINYEKADTPEERREIRERMKEMKKERYDKDSENKKFLKEQQSNHKNHNLQILGSIALVANLAYTFRKPIIKAGKSFITKF